MITNFVVAAIENLVESQSGSNTPPRPGLIPIGTPVGSTMHGRPTGTIVAYNNSPGPGYDSERYPYIILWCDGYRDCYGINGNFIWANP